MSVTEAAGLADKLLGPIKYATGDTTRGISGKVITIGGVATVKDSTGIEPFPGVCEAAKARFERANREGGVNGYTFNYVGCSDDGANSGLTRQKLKDLTENKKVFAVVPYTSMSTGVGDLLDKAHVPYFGWGLTPGYCGWSDRQFGFSVTSAINCTNVIPGKSFFSSVTFATYLAGTHKKAADLKLALVGSNDAVSVGPQKGLATIAKGLGFKVVLSVNPVPAAGAPPLADYTPLAQSIIASGANVVTILTAAGPVFGLNAALRANGYKGDVIIGFSDPRLVAVINQIDKAYANTANIGTLAFPSATFTQMTADLKAIGSSVRPDFLGSVTSYAAADLFIAALKGTTGPLTAEKLVKTLNSGFTYPQLGNVNCESIWPAAHAVVASCGALVQFDAAAKKIQPIQNLANLGSIYLLPSE